MAEFSITHVFDAPREVVFQAWLDPDQASKWWGPEGFDAPIDSVSIEARVGGSYTLVMRQLSDGAEFPVRGEITELTEPELLVIKFEAEPEVGIPDETFTRVELAEEEGKTRMTMTSGGYTDEMAPNAQQGWTDQFGKLDRLLAA